MEQWRRQVLGIYKSEREGGSTPLQAKKDAFRIAGGVGPKYGWLKEGTLQPPAGIFGGILRLGCFYKTSLGFYNEAYGDGAGIDSFLQLRLRRS